VYRATIVIGVESRLQTTNGRLETHDLKAGRGRLAFGMRANCESAPGFETGFCLQPAGDKRQQSGHQDRNACEVQKRTFKSLNNLDSLSPKTNGLLEGDT
jgi:hypothetical protein